MVQLNLDDVRAVVPCKELLDILGLEPEPIIRNGRKVGKSRNYRNPERQDNNPSCSVVEKGLWDFSYNYLIGYTSLVMAAKNCTLSQAYDFLAQISGVKPTKKAVKFPLSDKDIHALRLPNEGEQILRDLWREEEYETFYRLVEIAVKKRQDYFETDQHKEAIIFFSLKEFLELFNARISTNFGLEEWKQALLREERIVENISHRVEKWRRHHA